VLVRVAENLTEDHDADLGAEEAASADITEGEVKGMRYALITLIVIAVVFTLALAVPASPMRGEDGGVLSSPLLTGTGIALVIGVVFMVVGMVHGIAAKTITQASDIPGLMGDGVKQLGPILVLFFAAAQFIAYFTWSNLGTVLAVKGADLLEQLDFPSLVLFGLIILLVAVLNLFITSGSAEWALLAPVLVPMLMLMEISPEVTQMLFRMGDSPTNVISPMSPYFA